MFVRKRHLWIPLVIAGAHAGASVLSDGGLRRTDRLHRDVATLTDHNATLATENAELRKEIAALKGDPLEVERAVREELGLIREGEFVVVVEEP